MNASHITPSDVLVVLWRRKGRIIAVSLICGALGFGISRVLPLRYASEGLLELEAPGAQAQATPNASGGTEILRSDALLEAIAADPDLALPRGLIPQPRWPVPVKALLSMVRPAGESSAGEDRAAVTAYIAASTKITRADSSPVVTIQFTAATPGVAADVVNRLMAAYIAANAAARGDANARTSAVVMARVQDLEDQLRTANRRLQDFQDQHRIVAVQAGSAPALELTRQQEALAAATQDVDRLTASVATARDLAAGSAGAAATQETLSSPTIQSLRAREADTLQRIAQARSLGPQHPQRLALDDELRHVRAEIAAEIQKIVLSQSRDLDIARQRAAALATDVSRLQADASSLQGDQAIEAQLTHDVEAKRALLQTFLARAGDVQLASLALSPGRVVAKALPPLRPEPSHAPMMVLFGVVLGGLAMAGLFVIRHAMCAMFTSASDLAAVTGMRGLGSLPALHMRRRQPMARLAIEQGQSPLAETLRGMRFALQGMNGAGSCLCLLVTSAEIGEGKTSIAASLARRAAADGARVLLIDADLRRSGLAQALGVDIETSLEVALAGEQPFDGLVQTDIESGLHCLLAANTHDNPTMLLTSPRFGALLAFGRARYDLVVIDSPPVLRVSDPIVMAPWSDIVLFAVRSDRTPQNLVMEALRRFPDRCQSRIATVLNRMRATASGPIGYYGGYGGDGAKITPRRATLRSPAS